MKYILYIDYRATYKPMTSEYIPMTAKNISQAIVEADSLHDPEKMYLIQILEKNGKALKVESDIKAQAYSAIMEKRSAKWTFQEGGRTVKHYMAKFGDWYDIA